MSVPKTFPGAATGAQTQQPSADAVLAAAAQTAQPGAQPEVQKQPPELFTDQSGDAAVGNPPFSTTTDAKLPPQYPAIQPVYSLERARALPELATPSGGQSFAYVPFESDDPKAILAFKEEDGRTMRVAVALDCLAKIEVRREPVA